MHRTWLWPAALCLALAACHGTSNHSSTCTYFELGQTLEGDRGLIARRPGDGTVQIAVYRDGRLLGPEGVDGKMAELIPDDRGLWVSHPELPEWQRRLEDADRLAASPDARPERFIEILEPIPFRQVVARVLREYAANEPARAVAVLDALGDLALGGEDTLELVALALAADGLHPEHLARWLRQGTVGQHAEAAKRILEAPAADDETRRAALATLDHYYGSKRRVVYEAAARPLASSGSDAGMLAHKLTELYGSHRREAALQLLEEPDVSTALSFALVRGIDIFYGSDRLQVFLAAARRIVAEPEAGSLIPGTIGTLYGSNRREAALAVIAWPETRPELAGGFANIIDKFYGSDRAKVLEAVIASPGFTGTAQRACVEAAKKLYGRDRRRILVKIASSSRATDETKAYANEQLIRG